MRILIEVPEDLIQSVHDPRQQEDLEKRVGLFHKIKSIAPVMFKDIKFEASAVYEVLKSDNFELARIMLKTLNDENFDELLSLTITEDRMDLLSFLAEEKPEIIQNELIAQALEELHNISSKGGENEEDPLSIFCEECIFKAAKEEVVKVSDIFEDQLYANLEY